MSKSFATLIDNIQSKLGADAAYTDAIVTVELEHSIREISEDFPYARRVSYAIESRTGTATTDTGDALVDATESQFLSTDVDKVIHNTQNNTWALVTAHVGVDQLTISKDIMVDGDEDYEMFNKGCHTKYQINIEDVNDYVGPAEHGVIAVEYPIGTRRNWTIDGDILTIAVDSVSDSKVTDIATDTEVLVWFETRQRVSQLADLAGTVSGTVAAGAKTFTIAAVGSGTDVIAEDTLFTFYASTVRGTYKIKYDLTLSGGGGVIVFWPELESAPADGAIVAFIGSTLNTKLERLVVELTAAKVALTLVINATTTGGRATVRDYRDQLAIALNKLERLKNRQAPRTSQTFPKD